MWFQLEHMDEITRFLSAQRDISLGYSEITFFDIHQLQEKQAGYSHDGKGHSLITGNVGAWQKEWLVIGYDEAGDPLIVDLSAARLLVLSAIHGEENWQPYIIADSLHNFAVIIESLRELSMDRESPFELGSNPLPKKKIKEFLAFVKKENPLSALLYWKSIMEQSL